MLARAVFAVCTISSASYALLAIAVLAALLRLLPTGSFDEGFDIFLPAVILWYVGTLFILFSTPLWLHLAYEFWTEGESITKKVVAELGWIFAVAITASLAALPFTLVVLIS